jgi:hypothetical protein
MGCANSSAKAAPAETKPVDETKPAETKPEAEPSSTLLTDPDPEPATKQEEAAAAPAAEQTPAVEEPVAEAPKEPIVEKVATPVKLEDDIVPAAQEEQPADAAVPAKPAGFFACC